MKKAAASYRGPSRNRPQPTIATALVAEEQSFLENGPSSELEINERLAVGGELKDDQDQRITGNEGYPLRHASEIPSEPPVLEKPFHNEHQQNEQGCLLGADIEERHGEQTGITDPRNISP